MGCAFSAQVSKARLKHRNNPHLFSNSNQGQSNWKGWYDQNGQRIDMHLNNFQASLHGGVSGSGSDLTGSFTLSGTMTSGGQVQFVKQTGSQAVMFNGHMVGDVIQGSWNAPGNLKGTFRLSRG